ncbi:MULTISPECIES: hypothetical protein [Pseudoxanthomonas]|jgi:hypothetical protein|uniref:Uncharacterized protein n=2 Tax=Pseudoxanthomonas taiwanensis TaxID=176598 RepID=A0A921TF08_9GAMM|nr:MULTISPECIES: hypothetical protein [Pseudoxanthomonas]KAF1685400.1 hypothetical protein CR938_12955 [Pseudoxanthomonas taiwanensis]TWH09640.1 hypothetical protein L613_003400000180 [Pseudoxanthomonas taiwanensis J19]
MSSPTSARPAQRSRRCLPDLAGRGAIIALRLAGKPVDLATAVATRGAVKRAMPGGDDTSATVPGLEDRSRPCHGRTGPGHGVPASQARAGAFPPRG